MCFFRLIRGDGDGEREQMALLAKKDLSLSL